MLQGRKKDGSAVDTGAVGQTHGVYWCMLYISISHDISLLFE